MKHSRSIDNLSKLLAYMLGRQPDEFGLLPDGYGYVKLKDLLKALGEEDGWRHVRVHQIREVIHAARTPALEMEADRIRALDRSRLIQPMIPDTLPTLLYHPVRQRAHAVVVEKGLPASTSRGRLVLTTDRAWAERLGRRFDPDPVILTVHSNQARQKGATLWRFGRCLYFSDRLPLGSFSAPRLSSQRVEPKKPTVPEPPAVPKTPGSYRIDPAAGSSAGHRSERGPRRRKNEWKRERKRKSRGQGV